MLMQILATDPNWVLTLARIILGIIFFAHGSQKVFGWFGGPGLRQTMRTLTQVIGLPAIVALTAVGTELVGGGGAHPGIPRSRKCIWHRSQYAGGNFHGAWKIWPLHELVWRSERPRHRVPSARHCVGHRDHCERRWGVLPRRRAIELDRLVRKHITPSHSISRSSGRTAMTRRLRDQVLFRCFFPIQLDRFARCGACSEL